MPTADRFTTRPLYLGRRGLLASGHYLAARAGQRMFDRGGTAIDAGIASGVALGVVLPHLVGVGGEAPMLVYPAAEKKVFSISGQGFAARAATVERFRQLKIDVIPGDGFLPATTPAAFGSWCFALQRFGTLTLKDVLEPTIDLTENGYPVFPALRTAILGLVKRFTDEWPASAAIYLSGGKAPPVGHLIKNPDLARVLKRAVEAETKARKHGRADAIQAGIDSFYKGDVARIAAEFLSKTAVRDASKRAHKGLLTRDDFAAWKPTLEPPASVTYRGCTVYKCGPWTQGPVLLQQLRLLEGFDLTKMGHNTASYIHTLAEAAKLAYADRERYYGDPAFVSVPLDRLLSKGYADERRKLIDPNKASMQVRPGEGPPRAPTDLEELRPAGDDAEVYDHDTTHTCAIDERGNMLAVTPSGGWIPSSPVIPGLGFALTTRGQIFDLDPHSPNVIAPHKRPRSTLTPSLALKGGKPYMVFGSPGGDGQDQWLLQFFLNVIEFGMTLSQAVDAPTFQTTHFRSSFYPRRSSTGGLVVEDRIPEATRKELAGRGHRVSASGAWSHGMPMAVQVGPVPGTLCAGVAPRRETGYVTGD